MRKSPVTPASSGSQPDRLKFGPDDYSYIAPPMIGRYQAGRAYLAAQGRIFTVRYGYGEAANWQHLEDAARQAIGTYRYAPYGLELSPCPAALAAQIVR